MPGTGHHRTRLQQVAGIAEVLLDPLLHFEVLTLQILQKLGRIHRQGYRFQPIEEPLDLLLLFRTGVHLQEDQCLRRPADGDAQVIQGCSLPEPLHLRTTP